MKKEWSGEKITVSYIAMEDLGDICEMLAKESVCRWLFFGPNSYEVTEVYFTPLIESVMQGLSDCEIPESPVFTIRSKETGDFAGQCAILPVDFSPGAYLIGYQIDDGFQGLGFGTEACEFLVYYAFNCAGAYRLNGDAVYENSSSWKIMERCGFTFEGRRKKYWHARIGYYDQVLYGLLKDSLDEHYATYLNEKWSE
ncbi:GNAT family N-acetyltransferase [Methanoplanus endosymbiosus]|uniref:GNAT family N-acetyltransferase n=1 Tax=Methanoplanus endosymbiosus TaxID=33865 RepID=A0A9E7PJS0_9EURY|nr:GNAT family protein [Methanoplanus endosymbiosus]UUX91238.1 GNAT family N-acetyltransferase [Methanoplanus endosymbiosus]